MQISFSLTSTRGRIEKQEKGAKGFVKKNNNLIFAKQCAKNPGGMKIGRKKRKKQLPWFAMCIYLQSKGNVFS